MTKEEIQYEAQSIIQECSSNDSTPYVEFVEKLASMELPEPPSNLDETAEDMLDDAAYDWVMDNFGNPKESLFDFDCRCFKAGAEWMAGQFQKIEGELVDWYSTSDGKDYCCGISTNDAFEVPEGFYIRKK